jgi:flagellar basal-body rod protein FlgG
MTISLWTGALGMIAEQFRIDTTANNLSNINTAGYKKMRADFEDLIYNTILKAGTPATSVTEYPTGIQIGYGVKVSATEKLFTQGSIKETGNISDMAIVGEGFFKVRLPNGDFAYTRNGAFKIDSNGQFVSSDGYFLEPPIILRKNAIRESLTIDKNGVVRVRIIGVDNPQQIGQIELYRFINPAGLQNIGENLYKVTSASGGAISGLPGSPGFGRIMHKYLEMSNVKLAEEMVELIVAQRAYEANSKTVQTSDSMLQTAIALKR